MNRTYLYTVILLLSITIIGGCISIDDIQKSNNIAVYEEHDKIPHYELKINNADDHSRQIILTAVNRTDRDVVKYISSINVVSKIEDSECNNENITGCAIGNFTADGKLKAVKIYLLNSNSYGDTCNTFERTIYHEIGHSVYFYKFGNHDITGNDELYHESLELYADKYADIYYKVQKNGCDEESIRELKYKLDEKEKIYEYSLKILSKWDRYKNDGIPRDMYDEYQYDYDSYLDAKRLYMEALEEFKSYMMIEK